ncbi:class I SAM-dependent methyltransferase [Bradyrhizobium prioriisuperbiae]|uniref:class I SAM-dependent methyltransferase n=1 Tax=Bradyrhizobium prioriisuperbiae TaxID=2854389 RepID=UPI0028E52C43|nr:class I SAM-dependent methyltransferase [Bradyrhizobium prioritasuperba]
MTMVSYDRQTINSPNPLARFAHRSRVAKSVAFADKNLAQNGVVVDFGAGTGLFLSTLGDKRPDATLYAIEPYMPAASDPRIHYVPNFDKLTVSPDLITAFESCEHLSDANAEQFLSESRRALKPDGKLIISVPIMIGGALLLKELNRSILFRRKSDYSTSELLAGVAGRPVARPDERNPTHKGFDFRWLRGLIRERFVIETEILSPLPLPWWANSQIFFICRKA